MAQEPGDVLDRDDDDDINAELDSADPVGEDATEGKDTTDGAEALDNDIEVVLADGDDDGDGGEPKVAEDAGDDGGDDTVEGAAADDPEGEELDEEAKGYSANVQKRILRERRLTRRAREEGQQGIFAERQKRIDAERRILDLEQMNGEVLLAHIDQQITGKTAELKKAKEDAETDAELKLQGELDDLRAQRREADALKTRATKEKEAFEARAKQELAPQHEIPPEAKAWVDRNRWLRSPQFKAEALFVRAIDGALAREYKAAGKPIGDAAYFREIDRRVARELPDLKARIARVFRQPSGKPRSAVAPVTRTASAPTVTTRAGKKVYNFSKKDAELMRNFRMDPDDPKQREAWAREKLGLPLR